MRGLVSFISFLLIALIVGRNYKIVEENVELHVRKQYERRVESRFFKCIIKDH